MPQILLQFIDELRKNTRLRMGVWFIVSLLISYTILLLHDEQKKWQQEYNTAATRLTQLQQMAQQTQWNERVTQAKTFVNQLEAQLWKADTSGLAQANFQKWLNGEIQKAKIESTNVQIEPALQMTTTKQLWRVTARVQGDFYAKQLDSLLLAIALNPQLIIIENIEIRGKASKPKFTLVVHAYFQLTTNVSS